MRRKNIKSYIKMMRHEALAFYSLSLLATTLAVTPSSGQDVDGVRPENDAAPRQVEKRAPSAADEAEAQLALALAYFTGEGLTKDVERSVYWFTKSAEGGNAEAQFNLGAIYSTGQGVAQNSLKAVEWFTMAAARGHSRACYNLGVLYAKGEEGVQRDVRRALNLFQKSAVSGDPKGQAGLAWLYGDGLGVKADKIKAYAWACLSAENDEQGRATKAALHESLSQKEREAAVVLSGDLVRQLANALKNEAGAPTTGAQTPPQSSAVKQQSAFRKTPPPLFSGAYEVPQSRDDTPEKQEGFQKLLLQQTPKGLAYHLDSDRTINPNRIRCGWQDGVARQVCDGIFVDTIEEDEGPQKGVPVQLKFALEPDGSVRITVSGVLGYSEYFSYTHFDGIYRKPPKQSDAFDKRFSQAMAILQKLDEGGADSRERLGLSQKAATLVGGGELLAAAFRAAAEDGGRSRFLVRDIWQAQRGDYRAMKAVLEWLGGASGRVHIDPKFALKCYSTGKIKNSDFAVVFEGRENKRQMQEADLAALRYEAAIGTPLMLEIAKAGAACATIDLEALFAKHGVEDSFLAGNPDALWELAEEASKGGRFGKPNPELALQIMVRGGGELKEIAAAVRLCFDAWKAPNKTAVKVLPLISRRSGGASGTRTRTEAAVDKLNKEDVQSALDNGLRGSFEQASAASVEFINALSLRFSGSRGFPSWELNRRAFCESRYQEYLKSIGLIRGGFAPKGGLDFESSDNEMSRHYAEALVWLRVEEGVFTAEPEGEETELFHFDSIEHLKIVQRLWIKHRDQSAALFHRLNPALSEMQWRAWITRVRSDEILRLKEQAGVPNTALEPLRERIKLLSKESFELYRKYESLPKDSFSRGLVRPGVASPEALGKKAVGQIYRLIENELGHEPQIPWTSHGAFTQVYQLIAWGKLLEQTINFTEAVLRCNPEELEADPSGYYEDFEGGVLCVCRDGKEYLVYSECQRTVTDLHASLVFSGELAGDVITGAHAASGKAAPRLLVGKGMVCLEPHTDNTAAALANTYVRVGVLNEEGCKLVKNSDIHGTFAAGSRDNFVEGFSANGLKRFAPVKYGADFREAATESRQILDQVLQKK